MAGKHHCIAGIPMTPNPACFTQVNSLVHCGCPVAGLSIHHCRVKPLTMPATEVSGASMEPPAKWVSSYLLGHLWTLLTLLYKPHEVVKFYCSLSTWMATKDSYLFTFPYKGQIQIDFYYL